MKKATNYIIVLIVGIMLGYAWAAQSYLARIKLLERPDQYSAWMETWLPPTIDSKH